MVWSLEEAIAYYKSQGAPRDQSALTGLLKEIQQEHGGAIPGDVPGIVAEAYGITESFVTAVIRRIPSLHLADFHLLEICSGPNCGKATALAAYAETLSDSRITVKWVPCMRLCGKGPNIRWDGKLYHGADPALLKELTQK